MKKMRGFVGDENGATAIEYGLIAGLIALVIVVAITNYGAAMGNVFNYVSSNAGNVWINASQ